MPIYIDQPLVRKGKTVALKLFPFIHGHLRLDAGKQIVTANIVYYEYDEWINNHINAKTAEDDTVESFTDPSLPATVTTYVSDLNDIHRFIHIEVVNQLRLSGYEIDDKNVIHF